MTHYWVFELARVAERVLYLDHLRPTETFMEVALVIEGFHKGVEKRPWRSIPV